MSVCRQMLQTAQTPPKGFIPVKVLPGASRPALPGGGDELPHDGFLEIDVLDLDMARHAMNDRSSVPASEWTLERLCMDKTICVPAPGKRSFDDGGFYARVLGRECRTGLSVTLTVKTSAYVVIEFDEDQKTVDASRVKTRLIEAMRAVVAGNVRARKKARPNRDRYRQEDNRVSTEANEVERKCVGWRLEVLVEYHKRAFGFHPDLEHPPHSEDPTLHVRKFPFALVYVHDHETRDLVSEAVYLESLPCDIAGRQVRSLKSRGWRMAETAATPTLQFLEAAGIKPSCPIRVPVNRITFPTKAYYYTTDIEGTMSFDPLAIRARHVYRTMPNARYQGEEHVRTHGPARVGNIRVIETSARSPFQLGRDMLSIPRKRLAVFDLETVTSRANSFPDKTL